MIARELTPAQRRALLLRRCGLPWRAIFVAIAWARMYPNAPLYPGLQRYIGREAIAAASVEREAAQ